MKSIVGSLLYISRFTRPDISFATNYLSRHKCNPNEKCFNLAFRILSYLKRTEYMRLKYNCNSPFELIAYSGSDWAADHTDRKSISGYCMFLLSSLVSWSSQKQKSVALSIMEAEYVSIASALKEILFILSFLNELKIKISKPKLFCDNQTAVEISVNPKEHQRAKHIDIKFHFIRNVIANGIVELCYVNYSENPADIFTKPLAASSFFKHSKSLGMREANRFVRVLRPTETPNV